MSPSWTRNAGPSEVNRPWVVFVVDDLEDVSEAMRRSGAEWQQMNDSTLFSVDPAGNPVLVRASSA